MRKKILAIVMAICCILTSRMICNAEVSNNISSDIKFYDLIDEINGELDTLKSDEAIDYAVELYEIMIEVPEKLLIEEILNTSNNASTRALILQIAQKLSKDIDYTQFEYLLYDESEALEIKENILINIFLNGGNKEILEKVINSEDGVLAFQALKYLYQIDSVSAINIANQIISSSVGEFCYKERAAVIVKALDLKAHSTQEERLDFISYCDSVIEKNINSERIVLDTITYALSDINSIESLAYIVNCDLIDDSAKEFCIKQNYDILNENNTIVMANNNTLYRDTVNSYIQEINSQNISTNAIYPSNWAKGYAIYRNGVIGNLTWHGGLMNSTQISFSDSIIHIAGPNNIVAVCNLSTFLDGDDFMGYYLPYRTISSELLNDVVNTARSLTTQNIAYAVLEQMTYIPGVVGTKIDPSEILKMRCDGVVEYCYEYHGIRIYGSDSGWNISDNLQSARDQHSLNLITPRKQARNYMVNMLGDVDCDRYPTATDANLVLRFAAASEIPNTYQSFVGDVNLDGRVNAEDAKLILQYAAKIIDVFPGDPIVWE